MSFVYIDIKNLESGKMMISKEDEVLKWSNIYWANIGINLLGFLCYEIRNFVHESINIFNRLVFYDTQTLPCI